MIDDWSGFAGYADSGCFEVDAAALAAIAEAAAAAGTETDANSDGAAYFSFGAAIVATSAALAF